jgi:hypothetical protein
MIGKASGLRLRNRWSIRHSGWPGYSLHLVRGLLMKNEWHVPTGTGCSGFSAARVHLGTLLWVRLVSTSRWGSLQSRSKGSSCQISLNWIQDQKVDTSDLSTASAGTLATLVQSLQWWTGCMFLVARLQEWDLLGSLAPECSST